MGANAATKHRSLVDSQESARLLAQYGCASVRFAGTSDALFDRHLLFDAAIDVDKATSREHFDAFARSVRDVLLQRWLLTEKTYERCNPKRLYSLSMEFLIGRSLSSNVLNLMLGPLS